MIMIRLYLIVIIITLSTYSSHSQKIIRDIGDYVQIGLPLTGLGLSLATKDKEGTYQLLKSFVLQTGTTHLLKRVVKRDRPSGGSHSFPSGHTSLSFMGSTFLWKRYGWKYGVPATLAASFVGYSRFGIDDPVHHPSDVIAGAVLGVLSSLIFTKERESGSSIEIKGDTTYVGVNFKLNLSRF
jgi:membrane-associated phospholipid phosphatase